MNWLRLGRFAVSVFILFFLALGPALPARIIVPLFAIAVLLLLMGITTLVWYLEGRTSVIDKDEVIELLDRRENETDSKASV